MQFCLKHAVFSLLSPFLKTVLADCISRWQSIVILGPRLCLRTAILNTQAPLLGTVFRGWKVHLSVRLRSLRTGLHLALCLPPLLLLTSFSSLPPSLHARASGVWIGWLSSLPHTSSSLLPMREECAAQFLVVKFATLSSGETSPYCGSYATLC